MNKSLIKILTILALVLPASGFAREVVCKDRRTNVAIIATGVCPAGTEAYESRSGPRYNLDIGADQYTKPLEGLFRNRANNQNSRQQQAKSAEEKKKALINELRLFPKICPPGEKETAANWWQRIQRFPDNCGQAPKSSKDREMEKNRIAMKIYTDLLSKKLIDVDQYVELTNPILNDNPSLP